MIELPDAPDTPRSDLPSSPVVKVSDLLFVAGRASVDASGRIVPDTFEGGVRRSIENLEPVLKTAGSDLRHVFQTRNSVRADADPADFTGPRPARTTTTNGLPSMLRFEIECIAVVRHDAPAQGDGA